MNINAGAADEQRTRDRLLLLIGTMGPVTTAQLVEAVGLTDTAVRRHLENLESDGHICGRSDGSHGRRGRPARSWTVSDAGHEAMSSQYQSLSTTAISFIERSLGEDGLVEFAQQRAREWEQQYASVVEGIEGTGERALALAKALAKDGYAASTRPTATVVSDNQQDSATEPPAGLQLCQGHCPIQRVAERYPQFCDAETEALSRLIGTHVQRLATLAQGDHVCTTFIPATDDLRRGDDAPRTDS